MTLPGLKTARERKGLTQDQLARLAGLTNQTISNIENGFNTKSLTAERIAKALGVKVAQLETAEG